MTGISIGASRSTTGLLSGGASSNGQPTDSETPLRTTTSSSSNNNSNNNNGSTTSRWRKMPWSRSNNNSEDSQDEPEASPAPSWTNASSAPVMGGNNDYGKTDHVQRHSFSSAWNARPRVLPSIQSTFRRRNTLPPVLNGGSTKDGQEEEAAAQNLHLSLYGDLLSTPPSTITFVVRRRQVPGTDGDNTGWLGSSGGSRKKLLELLGVRLAKTQGTNHRFQVVREDWVDDEEEKAEGGFSVAQAEAKNENERESSIAPPLLPPELTVLLRPGDFLESVDGKFVGGRRRRISLGKNRCWDEEDLCKTILSTMESFEKEVVRHESPNKTEVGDEAEANEAISSDDSKTDTEKDGNGEESKSSFCYYTTTLTFVCGGTTPPSVLESSSSSLTEQAAMDSSDASSSPSTKHEVTPPDTVTLDTSSEKDSSESPRKASNNVTPMVHRAYFVDQSRGHLDSNEKDGIEGALENFLGLETIQKSVVAPPKQRFRIGNKNNSNNSKEDENTVGSSLLHIGSIAESHWLAKQTKIKPGDVLLCADDIPCYNGELSPGDLSLVWRTALLTKVLVSDPIQDAISSKSSAAPPYVGITTCTIPTTRMESLRKSAVAVGGGALVGTGAVLMVTPLHPVGHAMAIGGLGVLGSEFEGPRKVFVKAKESAANLAARMKRSPTKAKEAEAEPSSTEPPASPSQESEPEQPSKSMPSNAKEEGFIND